MEQALERLISLIEPICKKKAMSISPLVSYNTSPSIFTYRFPSPIVLPDYDFEIALVNLETWYSFANIAPNNNLFRYSVDGGNTWKLIAIETGAYEFEALNDEIQRLMVVNGDWNAEENAYYITLSANTSTLKSSIDITNPDYKVDFTIGNTIRSILGFNSEILSHGYNVSENIINIIDFNSIFINCDCINESYVNGISSPVIYSFGPKVSPGFRIVESPVNLIYLPLNRKTLSEFSIWITDQDGRHIDFRGEYITCRFHIRNIR
jgi:hypothetical protein